MELFPAVHVHKKKCQVLLMAARPRCHFVSFALLVLVTLRAAHSFTLCLTSLRFYIYTLQFFPDFAHSPSACQPRKFLRICRDCARVTSAAFRRLNGNRRYVSDSELMLFIHHNWHAAAEELARSPSVASERFGLTQSI